MSLFLKLIGAHLCILIIKEKIFYFRGKGPAQGLYDIVLGAEAQYSVNFSRSNRKFYLSLHYNGSNSFYLLMLQKIYQFKGKDSEIK